MPRIVLNKRWIRQSAYLLLALILSTITFTVVVRTLTLVSDSLYSVLPYTGGLALKDIQIRTCSKLGPCGASGWARIPKDLLLSSSWTSNVYLFHHSSEKLDSQVIVDLCVGERPQKVLDLVKMEGELTREQLHEAASSQGWKETSHGLWVKYGEYRKLDAVTGINILFGDDSVDPRLGWKKISVPLAVEGRYNAYVSYRQGPEVQIPPPVLKINPSGKFKILQVADMHFSTGYGECRDPFPVLLSKDAQSCQADPRTLEFVNKVLDAEKPDFVVLSGDQIFGEESYDSETSLFKAVKPFIDRAIPYAITLGNHDDEGSLSREQIMALSCSLPFSLASMGPAEVDGFGNYVLTVEAPKSTNPAVSLYFLDTHSYAQNQKVTPGYDWLKPNQLEFVSAQHNLLKHKIKKYTHIHMTMAFFHIPLPEYREVNGQQMVGTYKEGITAPNYNSGGRKALGDIGVSVVSVGHDHCNDYCALHEKEENRMWLCYGGGSGEGGYGGYGGTSRRVRVFDIDTQENSIQSWKRLENSPETVFDQQLLVSGGVAVPL
ncbi:hypothetical protein BABINDRAFT_159016 [Babjeviella inositovora NRRL Y-12698]|uniref:Calcineurin-like phosphoesterase domain-containing protein n=1 Tax=Babjeviella inositovora NRRL Y-12698 TaxID=984486 RepID=A0A1E3QXM0_9ASCO|nr:uncharacterized protein BABINDRAFT_159016 [Babjeviella inositovora NRRL Y-12698]ODQ82420.1 hypothetical protein BABINDRAFT_159016 [Babjeviella inositovora NRRL Y-12698]